MNKILSVILVLAICMTALVSCKKKDESIPDGMKIAENEYVTYTLYIPENWVSDISNGFTSAYANDKSNISVSVFTWGSKYKSLEEYCNNYFESLKSTYKEISEPEKYADNQFFGEMNAIKYVYTITLNGVVYKYMQTFSYNAAQLYIFTYTATEENYDKHTDEVKSIMENFKA